MCLYLIFAAQLRFDCVPPQFFSFPSIYPTVVRIYIFIPCDFLMQFTQFIYFLFHSLLLLLFLFLLLLVQIAWLRVDTQTILTIQTHVITKNHRMIVTHAEKRAWQLKIRDVKESDKGWYMVIIEP